jgi:uncharacterized protein YkwD
MITQRAGTLARRLVVAAVAGAVLAAAGVAPAPVAAAPDAPRVRAVDGACEGQLLALHNAERASRGLAALKEDPAIDQISRAWAWELARSASLRHNPSMVSKVGAAVPSWRSMAENVGYASSATAVHSAYMGSSAHRSNILSSAFNRVGVGCVRDSRGRVWTAVNFVAASSISTRRPAPFASAGDASVRLRWWLLGQEATTAQVDADAAKLLSGAATTKSHAVYLATSTTHAAAVPPVTRLYYAAFLRHPDAGGLTYWIRARQGGRSLQSIATSFASSTEFRSRYGSLSDAGFVDQVYRNVLGRAPDASGATFWEGRLAAGDTRGEVLVGFSESAEHVRSTAAKVTVSWAFIQMLGRAPSGPERVTWEPTVATYGSRRVVEYLAGSYAFASRAGSYRY